MRIIHHLAFVPTLSAPQAFNLCESDICYANSRLQKRKKCAGEYISITQSSKNL